MEHLVDGRPVGGSAPAPVVVPGDDVQALREIVERLTRPRSLTGRALAATRPFDITPFVGGLR